MKIRTGFVSNSSSSSFVLIGKKMSMDELVEKFPGDEDWVYDRVEEKGLIYFGEESDVIGKELARSEDEVMEETELSFSDLEREAKIVAEILNVPLEEIKLITGTRMC